MGKKKRLADIALVIMLILVICFSVVSILLSWNTPAQMNMGKTVDKFPESKPSQGEVAITLVPPPEESP